MIHAGKARVNLGRESIPWERSKVVDKQAQAAVLGGILRVNPSPGTAKRVSSSTDFGSCVIRVRTLENVRYAITILHILYR
ncbi:MAG: hypothetical protein HY863_00565 [Chloroflexi bacterium]|nr:hypothetical protein [Chloroflexota bacterium]